MCAVSIYERGARHHAPKTRDAAGIKEKVEREVGVTRTRRGMRYAYNICDGILGNVLNGLLSKRGRSEI